eukprot:CAMPEP_0115521796 /NCGR_PEP_ID=MMETSP0271-20121206/79739_1 /TAXON_ID=71861 /ORGANISM="Scrippsiella trochoidea, Strain CCMP3099" /LENGTH=60 /DNA_ID=CAMNT_0002953055 /DNA_START=74 /DNA_END=256 /DNA_ORIENTATION=-
MALLENLIDCGSMSPHVVEITCIVFFFLGYFFLKTGKNLAEPQGDVCFVNVGLASKHHDE